MFHKVFFGYFDRLPDGSVVFTRGSDGMIQPQTTRALSREAVKAMVREVWPHCEGGVAELPWSIWWHDGMLGIDVPDRPTAELYRLATLLVERLHVELVDIGTFSQTTPEWFRPRDRSEI